jgi:pyruvate,water dikinase
LINYAKLNQQKKQLEKKYQLSVLFCYYLQILEDLYFLMDYKKEVLTKVHFTITPLYQEAGRRIGLDLNEVRWLSWSEVKTALFRKKRILKQFVHKRKKFGGIKFLNGKIIFLTAKQIKALLLEIKKDEKISKIKEIKGISGSPGEASGEICYLKSANECFKMIKGKILLVSNTTPDFMPAIRRARAIITNEGGITCHAAIISRELGIPCIIGTKIATQVLKNGDLVEVDANKGIIKMIK